MLNEFTNAREDIQITYKFKWKCFNLNFFCILNILWWYQRVTEQCLHWMIVSFSLMLPAKYNVLWLCQWVTEQCFHWGFLQFFDEIPQLFIIPLLNSYILTWYHWDMLQFFNISFKYNTLVVSMSNWKTFSLSFALILRWDYSIIHNIITK